MSSSGLTGWRTPSTRAKETGPSRRRILKDGPLSRPWIALYAISPVSTTRIGMTIRRERAMVETGARVVLTISDIAARCTGCRRVGRLV